MKNIIIVLIALIALISCKKYDEGPLISFRSKVNRLTGKWKMTNDTAEIFWELTKEQVFNEILILENKDTLQKNGNWRFEDDKENIRVTWPNPSVLKANNPANDSANTTSPFLSIDYKILKLRNDKLWLIDEDNHSYYFESY